MERLRAAQKSPKQHSKSKRSPVKVVYISNPVKVRASESEFMAVVQELTGQYSGVAESEHPTAGSGTVGTGPRKELVCRGIDGGSFGEVLEEAFAPPLVSLDSFSGLIMPPTQLHNCGAHDGAIWSLEWGQGYML